MEKAKEIKGLPNDIRDEMNSYSVEKLKDVVVNSEQQKEELKKELENNAQYQSALSVKKDIEGGQRDVKKVLNAKIKYALQLLEFKGKV